MSWYATVKTSEDSNLPPGLEDRLWEFADLVREHEAALRDAQKHRLFDPNINVKHLAGNPALLQRYYEKYQQAHDQTKAHGLSVVLKSLAELKKAVQGFEHWWQKAYKRPVPWEQPKALPQPEKKPEVAPEPAAAPVPQAAAPSPAPALPPKKKQPFEDWAAIHSKKHVTSPRQRGHSAQEQYDNWHSRMTGNKF